MKKAIVVPLVLSLPLFVGCSETCRSSDPSGVTFNYSDPKGDSAFFAHPWPSNAQRREDGTLTLLRWPNQAESSTLDEYLQVIGENTNGFGRSSAIYMSFSGALDPATLPTEPLAAAVDEASLFLVDIDPDSPEKGRKFPLQVRYSAAATQYLPENHLIALPPFGIVLRSNTTYALVGTTEIRGADGDSISANANLHNALRAQCEPNAVPLLYEVMAPLRAYLEETSLSASDIAAATVFTTQDSLGELRRLGDAARAEPSPEVRNLVKEEENAEVVLIRGEIEMPSFQAGDVPYVRNGDGGGLNWDENGIPRVHHTETTRIGIMLPKGWQMPPEGFPVVLMSHGTGADYRSAYSPDVADQLAGRGMAVVSYDPTLHGPRDPTGADENLTFFNLFNIIAGRDNVRQGAADCVIMTKLIQSMSVPGNVTGMGEVRFDPNRMAFLGHSQGGIVGAGCLAVEPAFRSAVFSGTAAVLTITLLERKDPVDFLALITNLLAIPDDEPMDDFHPVLNLIQTFIEPADPIAYASSFLSDPPNGAVRDFLLVEGFKDSASPARGHEALSSAVGAPLISPFFRIPAAQALIGPSPQNAPVEANVMSATGPVTVGLIQYPERDHWPIFTDIDANARYVRFLQSSLFDGRARIPVSQYER